MHACNVSFADASKALQTANNNNLDAAIALLRTEGVVHEHGDNPPERSLMLQDIRVRHVD
ncbi:hypothetical protein BC938DRAFT_477596 [Jimgerdemannia flammicorona]|uniref:Uncharacterized protein n=1 Tax=Jimgerdemannia flammicorona TaxID=994334 RepID=A0A433P8U5_9FUNG|nr:hypothetical protein BC938DRAFT_477596 [Jimgerdemannia flammicorona]